MPKPTPEIATTARVLVITHGLRIGDHKYAAGHIIEALPIAEAEFRAKSGDVEVLNVNPPAPQD